MKFKSFLRRTTAAVLAAGCLFSNITAYADDERIFNPIYSGKLSYRSDMYMNITSTISTLRCVWYNISGNNSKLVSISGNPIDLAFDATQFCLRYNKPGTIMTTDGTIIGTTHENIEIETLDVTITYNFLHWVSHAKVVYNGIEYNS